MKQTIKLIALTLYGPLVFVYLALTGALFKKAPWFPKWYRRSIRDWSIHLLTMLDVTVNIDYESEKNLAAVDNEIVVASHKSHLESVILWAIYPLKKSLVFVANKELFQVPLICAGLKAAGAISIDRTRGRESWTNLREAVAGLSESKSLLVFPEMTKKGNGQLGSFKKSAFILSNESGRNLLPICFYGTENVMPKGAWIPRPGTVTVKVLRPIPAALVEMMTVDQLAEHVWSDMNKAMEREIA